MSCIAGTLKKTDVTFKKGAAACVVLAAEGYPGKYQKGTVIEGLDRITDPNIVVFHAGTMIKDGKLVTNGGRVAGVTAYAETLEKALKAAYEVIGPDTGVYFKNMQLRTDIGKGQLT
jgi:phosphoribosylamine--glycine ligase